MRNSGMSESPPWGRHLDTPLVITDSRAGDLEAPFLGFSAPSLGKGFILGVPATGECCVCLGIP